MKNKKINEWDLLLKSICTAKETISERKRQPSEWKKILAKENTYKEFMSNTYNLHSSIFFLKIHTIPKNSPLILKVYLAKLCDFTSTCS